MARKFLLGSSSVRMVAVALTVVSVTAWLGAPVLAADLPVKIPQAGTVAQPNDLYFWMDGSAVSVSLPTFDLGVRHIDSSFTKDLGAATSFDPRATGAGVAGGIGYVLPYGTLSSMLEPTSGLRLVDRLFMPAQSRAPRRHLQTERVTHFFH